MTESTDRGLTLAELHAERAIALPDKEVVSVIDVNADINLAINAASPIDLAAAANLNVAAPIQAAAGANVLTYGSDAVATATHGETGTVVNQYLGADATATSSQDSAIDQGAGTGGEVGGETGGELGGTTGGETGGTTGGETGGTTGGTTGTGSTGTGGSTGTVTTGGGLLSGSLLNVNVTVDLNTDLAAPIGGAAAINGNVAAPINAGVAANIGSINSHSTALSVQDALVNQTLTGTATATQDQISQITQGGGTTTGTAAINAPTGTSGATGTGSTAGAASTR